MEEVKAITLHRWLVSDPSDEQVSDETLACNERSLIHALLLLFSHHLTPPPLLPAAAAASRVLVACNERFLHCISVARFARLVRHVALSAADRHSEAVTVRHIVKVRQ